jgi:hypothetical protein
MSLLVIPGAATVNGPLVGLIDQAFGPRFGLIVAGIAVAVLFCLSRRQNADWPPRPGPL